MRLEDHYDWIVLGDHPGALLSAALVARLGLSVLLLPGFSAPFSSPHFDPESNFILGIAEAGLIFECLEKLKLTQAELLVLQKIKNRLNYPQVVTAQHRIGFPQSPTDLQEELNREFGTSHAKKMALTSALKAAEIDVLEFWTRLPDRLTLVEGKKPKKTEPTRFKEVQKKVFKKTDNLWLKPRMKASDLSKYLGSPDVSAVLKGLWYSMSSSLHSNPSIASILQLMILGNTGQSVKGGLSRYREFLLQIAKNRGVHVSQGIECRRIFVEKGRFVGVQVSSHGNMITSKGGLLGCSTHSAFKRMVQTGNSWIKSLPKPKMPSAWKFSLALHVNEEVIPLGISDRIVWQEDGAPALEIEISNPSDYGIKGANYLTLYLRTPLPFTNESLDYSFQRITASRMIKKATEIFPFLEIHTIGVFPDYRKSAHSIEEDASLYTFSHLDMIPDSLKIYNEHGTGSSSGVEGLHLCSQEAYPLLGSLGPTVAALEATAWVAHKSNIPSPL